MTALSSCCKPADQDVQAADRISTVASRVDIHESADALVVTADMPGVDDAGVEVTVDRGILLIKGVADGRSPEGFKPIYQEYEAGAYERSFRLPDTIDADRISATIANGVLRVTLPKQKAAQPRKIAVKG